MAISDLTTGQRARRLRGHTGIINALSRTIAGVGVELLASAADDKTVRIWEGGVEGNKHPVATWDIGCPATAVCWGPDGNSVYIGALDNMIHVSNAFMSPFPMLTLPQVYDLRKGAEVIALGGHTDTPTSLSLSPDGKLANIFLRSDLTSGRIVYFVTIPLFTDSYS